MESNKIKVRWNKNYFSLDKSSIKTVGDLKTEIQKHSQIQTDEQKMIYKGKVLKDEELIDIFPNNACITMLGAAPKEAREIKPEVTFVEDLTQEQKMQILREKGEEIVFGLNNLGNTCYLNSTIQCLGRVKELREALKEYATNNQSDMSSINPEKKLTYSWGSTYKQLDKATTAVTPMQLVQVIREINPMFAEVDHGVCKQQDADECFSLLFNNIRNTLKTKGNGDEVYSPVLVNELFGIKLQVKLKNVENTKEEVETKSDETFKLICYIDNNTIELVEGLKHSLKENIEKFSETLQRNTIFEKSQLIDRLPNYLNVQFMRFYWKKANTLTGAKAGKAKILKSVIFSKIIDLYDLCTEETKELLNIGRKIENKLMKDDKDFKVENVKKEEGKEYVPTGRYQLISVLTHQGRSSESGHYIGWVHKKDDKWLKYDDSEVTMVTTNEVLELKGGGDWHMAYICIFKQLEVPLMEVE